jgi:hypothetical protein
MTSFRSSSVLVLLCAAPVALFAQAKKAHPMATKSSPAAAYVALAESAAPTAIGSKATIAKFDAKGNLTTVRAGTNDFTCIVGVPGAPDSPICTDKNATRWMVDAASNKPRPTNPAPGIAYMAQGGTHFENASGESVMDPKGAKAVKEPAHWMIMWPFTPESSGLPTKENGAGSYIMFAGSPYAHLMIYQNPLKISTK